MAGEADAVATTVETFQLALAVLSAAGLVDYDIPPIATVANNTAVDFLVVGAGTAGCVLANRLSENSSNTVMVLDAGGTPTLETTLPGIFTLEPNTKYDWNYTSVNNGYTAQNLQTGSVICTAGKMIGGSSGLNHMIHYQGAPSDFEPWAEAANDSSWNHDSLLKYIKKSEKLEDGTLLASNYSSYHGLSGNMRLTREPSDSNIGILQAYSELGFKVTDDVSGPDPFGACEPLYNIADGERQGGAKAYLSPIINRTNLYLVTYATVTEILFDSNNVATGVKYVNSAGETNFVYANKEVIISAGAIASPYLLLKSGFGPEAELEAAGISVKKDLPEVGKNLQDHISAPMVFTLNTTNATAGASNPHMFPVPVTTIYKDYDGDGSIPDYQIINFIFPRLSAGLLQLCLIVFKFKVETCQKIYDASANNILMFSIPNKSHPLSRGTVTLDAEDPSAAPVVDLGTFSNAQDLTDMGLYVADTAEILTTPYFESIGASLVDLGLCNGTTYGTTAYWECHALSMSATMWHYSGTCSMGSVVNNRLQVYGAGHLRISDASIMPSLTSGNINAAVVILAEKSADMILEDWGLLVN